MNSYVFFYVGEVAEGCDADAREIHRVLGKFAWTDDRDNGWFARRDPVRLSMDGASYCATGPGFLNIQESAAGFGDTALEAIANLAKNLGYRPTKPSGGSLVEQILRASGGTAQTSARSDQSAGEQAPVVMAVDILGEESSFQYTWEAGRYGCVGISETTRDHGVATVTIRLDSGRCAVIDRCNTVVFYAAPKDPEESE